MPNKWIILVLILVSCQSPRETQQRITDVSQKYLQARAYIDTSQHMRSYLAIHAPRVLGETASVPIENLTIYDSLVNMTITSFRWDLIRMRRSLLSADMPERKRDSILYRLVVAEEKRQFDQFTPAPLPIPAVPKATDSSKVVAFFSPLYDSLLVIEILPLVRGESTLEYKDLMAFSTGLNLMFIFDETGYIKDVMSKVIEYN